MAELFKPYKKVKLRNPTLVAAWPGMANVAVLAVNYLKNQLGAQPLGEIASTDHFAATGAVVSKQLIKPPEPPNNVFYHYQSPTSENDILIFLGSVQPVPHKEYPFAVELLRIAESFHVKSVYTTAAAPSDMHFKDTPRVFAVPNRFELLKKMSDTGVAFMGEGTVAGLNGLLISVAAERGMDGICLLGEIPFFTAQIEYPRASYAVLEVLVKLLGVTIDMVDLDLYASQKEKEIEPLAAMLTKEKPEPPSPQAMEEILPEKTKQEEEKVPRSVRLKIEKLFRQAEFDRTYKSKMRLKEELDKWELFDEYLDRFLDLFKKPTGES